MFLLGLFGALAGPICRQRGDQRAGSSDRLFGHRRTVPNRLVPSARWTWLALAADLAAEQDALDAVVAGLSPEQWQAPTPSPGWTVADQIGHLAYFDATATLAMTDPDAFQALAGS